MREQLWRYYPQALAIGDDLAADWFLEMWAAVPTPSKAARTRESTVGRVLRAHHIRRITAAEVLRTLRQPALTVAAGTVEAAGAHIRTVAERLKLVNRQIRKEAHRQLDSVCARLAEDNGDKSPATRARAARRDDPAILAGCVAIQHDQRSRRWRHSRGETCSRVETWHSEHEKRL